MKNNPLRLRGLCRLQSGKWLLAWTLGAITLFAGVALLAVSGWFISAAALAGLTALAGVFSFDYFRPAAIIRALAIARTAGRYGERLASHEAVLALLRDLRGHFFARIAANPQRQFVSVHALQGLSSDIDLLDNLPLRFFMPWLWALALQALLLLWLLWIAPSLAAWLSLPLLLAGIILPAAAAIQGRALARADADWAQQRRSLLLEPLRLLTPLLLWQRWADCRRDFLAADAVYRNAKQRQQYWASFYQWAQHCLLAFALLLLLWQALPLLQTQALSLPLLLAIVLALLGLTESLQALTTQYLALGFALAARDRLNALAPPQRSVAIVAPPVNAALNEAEYLIAEQLFARHAGALNGVENCSFCLARGEALIVCGRSGGGKSTLLDALGGELPLLSGRLRLDAQAYHPEYSNYLAQQVDIFDLSLADNLRLGENFSDEALWTVLESVDLADWARSQPQGLATALGEYGSAVSGGQARRIALARLLLRPKPVLLLDEPFAGLDEGTRHKLWRHLRTVQKNGWLIVASHHLPDNGSVLSLDKPF